MRNKLTDKQKILIDDYNDMAFIMSILCLKSCNYYGKIKYIIDFPIIFISATMSIINSNLDDPSLKYINISINILFVFLVSINNFFKVNEKCLIYKIFSDKFTKITHKIEESKINNTIDNDFISNIINQYETAIEGLNYDFPEHVKKSVRNEYKTHRTLPPIINNVKKLIEYRDIELSGITTGNNTPSNNYVPMKSSISYDSLVDNIQKKLKVSFDTDSNLNFENFFIENIDNNSSNVIIVYSNSINPSLKNNSNNNSIDSEHIKISSNI